jgi:hypothetical protein
MSHIADLCELARLYYLQTNAALDHPEVKKILLDLGDRHLEADELRRLQIIRAVFPKQ